MRTFWDRFAAIGGGVFGSMKSVHGFFFLNVSEIGMFDIMPELTRAFLFGFIGGFAGWAAKKSGDSLVLFLKEKLFKKSTSNGTTEK